MRWKITYCRKVFEYRKDDEPAPLRTDAFRMFLQHHPDISSKRFADFEQLWYALTTTLGAPEDTQRTINLPSQRFRTHGSARLRWSKKNILVHSFFSETFCFLQRKATVTESLLPDPRTVLAQPCDQQVRTCTYADTTWYCIVPTMATVFFDSTLLVLSGTYCFQQQLWSTDDFSWMWRCIQQTCASGDTTLSLDLRYAGQRYRRTVQSEQLVATAELLHFLHARPPMPLQMFLQCFDACRTHPASHWPFLCQTSTERQARLSAACEATSREPTSYPSDTADLEAMPPTTARERMLQLAHAASTWPAAVPSAQLLSHSTTYRSYFHDALKPPFPCATCACPTSRASAELLNLRELFPDLMVLHPILSANKYMQRYYDYHQCNLPPTFIGLRIETFQSYLATLPTELGALEPVPRLVFIFPYSSVLSFLFLTASFPDRAAFITLGRLAPTFLEPSILERCRSRYDSTIVCHVLRSLLQLPATHAALDSTSISRQQQPLH